MLLLVDGILIALLAGILTLRTTDRRDFLGASLAFGVLAPTLIVASVLFLHLVGFVASPPAYVVLHLLGAAGLLAWGARRGQGAGSLVAEVRSRWAEFRRYAAQTVWPEMRGAPLVLLVLAAVFLCALVGLVLVVATPPNNYDSMTYHLPRVGHWIQNNSLTPWHTPNLRETCFPINAEVLILWSTLMTGTSAQADIWQWLAQLVCAGAVYGLARHLALPRPACLAAAALWLTFPEVVLESTTTQNDLVVTAPLGVGLFFLLRLVRSTAGSTRNGLLSAASLAVAAGTKLTVAFAVPGVALWVAGVFVTRPAVRTRLLQWAAACAVFFLLVGAFTYAQNLASYGHPIAWKPHATAKDYGITSPRADWGATNVLVYLYDMVDFSGLPNSVEQPLSRAKAAVARQIMPGSVVEDSFGRFRLDRRVRIHEDFSWYGLVSVLAVAVAVASAVAVAVPGRRKTLGRGVVLTVLLLVSTAVFFFLFHSFLQVWTPHKNRYYTIFFLALAPFLGRLFTCRGRPAWRAVYQVAIVALAVFLAFGSQLRNEGKPVLGKRSVFSRPRTAVLCLNSPAYEAVVNGVDRWVPRTATVAMVSCVDDWEYPFFGERFSRRILHVPEELSGAALDTWYSEHGCEFVLMNNEVPGAGQYAEGTSLLESVGKWSVLFRQATADEATREHVRLAMGDRSVYPQDAPLVYVEGAAATNLRVLGLSPPAWGLEKTRGASFVWLGPGEKHALQMTLQAERECQVELDCRVMPSPHKGDKWRVLTVRHLGSGESAERNFAATEHLRIPLQLTAGTNEVRFVAALSADRALETLPGGDRRPLVLRVLSVTCRYPGEILAP